jgi:hypothetical protein
VLGLIAPWAEPDRIRRIVTLSAFGAWLICLLGGIHLATGFVKPMGAGYPLFCSAAPLFLIGLADEWLTGSGITTPIRGADTGDGAPTIAWRGNERPRR